MSTEMYNETELLKASMQGDTVAFEVIVKKYQSFICAITFSATADFGKSEELAQETFISAWKNLTQLKDISKFRGWLSSIARNKIRNSFRNQKRDLLQKAVSLDQIQEDGVTDSEAAEEFITKQQQAVVQQALKKIPEKYREPLVLFYREQQSIKQKATRTYTLTCFVNWTIHLLYLYNNIYTISLPGKLYYCLIAFIVYDDIILLKWLNN